MRYKAKWVVVTTVDEPEILYPLLTIKYSPSEIAPIDSILALILWPWHACPPKHFWKLSTHFLHTHIKPIIMRTCIQWIQVTQYQCSPSFYKHRFMPHLYQFNDGLLMLYSLRSHRRSRHRIYYEIIPYQCDVEFCLDDFTPVNTHFYTCGIIVVGKFYTNNSQTPSVAPPHTSLREAFYLLFCT
jgi:hypothetical protein